jgi:hypothetical protein
MQWMDDCVRCRDLLDRVLAEFGEDCAAGMLNLADGRLVISRRFHLSCSPDHVEALRRTALQTFGGSVRERSIRRGFALGPPHDVVIHREGGHDFLSLLDPEDVVLLVTTRHLTDRETVRGRILDLHQVIRHWPATG